MFRMTKVVHVGTYNGEPDPGIPPQTLEFGDLLGGAGVSAHSAAPSTNLSSNGLAADGRSVAATAAAAAAPADRSGAPQVRIELSAAGFIADSHTLMVFFTSNRYLLIRHTPDGAFPTLRYLQWYAAATKRLLSIVLSPCTSTMAGVTADGRFAMLPILELASRRYDQLFHHPATPSGLPSLTAFSTVFQKEPPKVRMVATNAGATPLLDTSDVVFASTPSLRIVDNQTPHMTWWRTFTGTDFCLVVVASTESSSLPTVASLAGAISPGSGARNRGSIGPSRPYAARSLSQSGDLNLGNRGPVQVLVINMTTRAEVASFQIDKYLYQACSLQIYADTDGNTRKNVLLVEAPTCYYRLLLESMELGQDGERVYKSILAAAGIANPTGGPAPVSSVAAVAPVVVCSSLVDAFKPIRLVQFDRMCRLSVETLHERPMLGVLLPQDNTFRLHHPWHGSRAMYQFHVGPGARHVVYSPRFLFVASVDDAALGADRGVGVGGGDEDDPLLESSSVIIQVVSTLVAGSRHTVSAADSVLQQFVLPHGERVLWIRGPMHPRGTGAAAQEQQYRHRFKRATEQRQKFFSPIQRAKQGPGGLTREDSFGTMGTRLSEAARHVPIGQSPDMIQVTSPTVESKVTEESDEPSEQPHGAWRGVPAKPGTQHDVVDSDIVNAGVIVCTTGGLYECIPAAVTEAHKVFRYLVKCGLERDHAEPFGLAMGLNLLALYEAAAEDMSQQGMASIPRALSLFRLADASPVKVIQQMAKLSRADLAIEFGLRSLKSARDSLPDADRSQIADLILQCFIIQILDGRAGSALEPNYQPLHDFIQSNTDYSYERAIDKFVTYGMIVEALMVGQHRECMASALTKINHGGADALLDDTCVDYLCKVYVHTTPGGAVCKRAVTAGVHRGAARLVYEGHQKGTVFKQLRPEHQVQLLLSDTALLCEAAASLQPLITVLPLHALLCVPHGIVELVVFGVSGRTTATNVSQDGAELLMISLLEIQRRVRESSGRRTIDAALHRPPALTSADVRRLLDSGELILEQWADQGLLEYLLRDLYPRYRARTTLERCVDWGNHRAAAIICELRGEVDEAFRCLLADCSSVLHECEPRAECEDAVIRQVQVEWKKCGLLCSSVAQKATVIAQAMAFWAREKLPVDPLTDFLLSEVETFGPAMADVLFGFVATPDAKVTGAATARAMSHLAEQTSGLARSLALPADVVLHVAHARIAKWQEDSAAADRGGDERFWQEIKRNLRNNFRDVSWIDIPFATAGSVVDGPGAVVAFTCGHRYSPQEFSKTLLPRLHSELRRLHMDTMIPFFTEQFNAPMVHMACPDCVAAFMRSVAR